MLAESWQKIKIFSRSEAWNPPTWGCKSMVEGSTIMLGVFMTLLCIHTMPNMCYCSTCMLLYPHLQKSVKVDYLCFISAAKSESLFSLCSFYRGIFSSVRSITNTGSRLRNIMECHDFISMKMYFSIVIVSIDEEFTSLYSSSLTYTWSWSANPQ